MRATFRMAAVATISLGLVLIGAPAEAKSRWSTAKDSRQDSAYGINIKRSTLDVRKKGFYRVKIFGYQFTRRQLNLAHLSLDTVPANPGPEYLVSWALPNDGVWNDPTDPNYDGNNYQVGLQLVDTWYDPDSTYKACPRLRVSKNLRTNVVTFLVPKACVGWPARVRWNVETERVITAYPDGSYDAYFDASPAERVFTRWVA